MPAPALAQDKRTVDQDGRMRVPGCRISKANVCPYYGREIPNFEGLGLDADRVYMMYRDPEELRIAAHTFDSIPLLNTHVPVTADNHAPEITVGTLTKPRFEYPYLVADLTVWTQDAINLVVTESQRELSSSYRYTADMVPGMSPEGVAFDGRMRQIMGNHLALVTEGRVGPDVLVADEKPKAMTKIQKIAAALAKLFASDGALAKEIDAMDCELSADERKAALDAMAVEKNVAADALSDEDKTEAYRRAASDKAARDAAGPGMAGAPAAPVGGAPKPGMDAAAVQVAVDAAIATARTGYVLATDAALAADKRVADVTALYAARDAVAEKTGLVNLTELTTAEAVYRYALDKLTVPHKDVAAEALPALYAGVAARPALAADVAPYVTGKLFPALSLVSRG